MPIIFGQLCRIWNSWCGKYWFALQIYAYGWEGVKWIIYDVMLWRKENQ